MKKFIKFIAYPITFIIGIVVGFIACLEIARRAGILDKTDDVEYYSCDYDDLDYMPGINNASLHGDTDIDVE